MRLKYKQPLFTDIVSGKRVYEYVDCYGDSYMKTSRWSSYAVKMEK